ncbi:Stk1 family PASTA domain-containing Ser/Thr kinase [Haloechinothrix salitolerans]|uniref:Stk1 family PASTA domain-containing Ser/Thr kinase n=1 Tax=Haloechinothrix salitolerans TaxID=926830 RepID=UPI0031EF3AE6
MSEGPASSATPAGPRLLAERYEVSTLIGRGGMSDVWRGRDVRLGREVAIKILRADLVRDESFQERFRAEACHSAALNHPAIVSLYDTGETEGPSGTTPFIVMEYVDGRTLRDILSTNGALDTKHALRVMADVCAALDFSHRHGVIHRDVKPGNIMLTNSGAVRVMDFGIARAAHDARAGMTLPSAVIGTAHYLSPEQVRGQRVDARSDVYAAGCTLYELLTGRPPFTGDSPVAVTYQHLQETPAAPSSVRPSIGEDLDAVVLKALTKGAANRYQSTIEMRSDLVRILAGKRPRAPRILAPDRVVPAAPTQRITADDTKRREDTGARRGMPYLAAFGAAAMLIFLLWQFNPWANEPVAAIPRISGQQFMAAESELRELGFTQIERNVIPCWAQAFGKKPVCGSDEYGRVLGTTPSEGTKVATSTGIVVDIGQAPRQFQMPSLIGKKKGKVRDLLEEKGLLLNPNIKELENRNPALSNQIVRQYPEPGYTVAQGETVKLTVYERPTMVRVVDYTGKNEEAARAGLSSVGFEVVTEWTASAEPKGTVVAQEPSSDKAVKGSSVVITVSDGSEHPMAMPDLFGMSEGEAREELTESGHTGIVQVADYDLAEKYQDYDGLVVATRPEEETTIKQADRVVLYIGQYHNESGKYGSPSEPTEPPGESEEPPPSGPPRPGLPQHAPRSGRR